MHRRVLGMILVFLLHTTAVWGATKLSELDCLIEPYLVVNIGSAVTGILENVAVDRGDLVQKDQVLITLEASVETAAVEVFRTRATMESPIRASQVRHELSARKHTREMGMFQRDLIPADKMDEAEATRRLSEISIFEAMDARRLAEVELQRATAELGRRTIRSPITGVVVQRFRSAGEFADEEPILKLAQLDPLRVEVFAPVALLGSLCVGMTAKVLLPPPLEGSHTAKVTVVDRVVDAASNTFGVRLELPNKGYRLPAGLKCRVNFQTK